MTHKNFENEEAKKLLKEYKQLIVRKKQLDKLISDLEKEVLSAKSPIVDPTLIGSNSSLASKISFLVDLKNEYENIVINLNNKILIIEKALMNVAKNSGVLYANILHYKFIEGNTLEAISVIIGYSYPQTIRIYNSALKNFYISFSKVTIKN